MSVDSQVRRSGTTGRRKLKPTLIVRIRGGIGNQLFQYALGRKITLETGMKLRFDHSEYDRYFNRSYCLNLLKTQVYLPQSQRSPQYFGQHTLLGEQSNYAVSSIHFISGVIFARMSFVMMARHLC